MTQILKVHCLGAGYFARFQLDAWHKMPETRIAGLCDADTAKADAVLTELAGSDHGIDLYGTAEAMFAAGPVDIIDIATPPDSHPALIAAAIKARPRMIICQKPFCGTIEAAKAATQAAAQAGIPLVVHENFRFQPWFRALKTEIGGARLGEIYQIAMRLRPGDGQGENAYLERQPYFRDMDRFMVHETGIHYVDVFRYLLGEPTAVFADLRKVNPGIAGEDAGLVIFQFDGHRRAILDGNRCADHAAADRRLTLGECLVEGSNGVIDLDGSGTLAYRPLHGVDRTPLGQWHPDGFGSGCVRALQQHVVDHLLSGSPIENIAEDYLRNMRIEEAIYESSERRAVVDLT